MPTDTPPSPEATHDDRTRREPQQHEADFGRGVAGKERNDRRTARQRRQAPPSSRQLRSVSVAELTGEIPIISGDTHSDISERAADSATDQIEEVRDDYTGPLPSNGAREYVEETRVQTPMTPTTPMTPMTSVTSMTPMTSKSTTLR